MNLFAVKYRPQIYSENAVCGREKLFQFIGLQTDSLPGEFDVLYSLIRIQVFFLSREVESTNNNFHMLTSSHEEWKNYHVKNMKMHK